MLELVVVGAGSFAIALSGALMPGPLLTVTIAESVRRGFLAGPLLITGHAILELLLVGAILLGLGPFLEMTPVTAVIALVGGGMLIWMGTGMVRSASKLTVQGEAMEGFRGQGLPPVILGILASLSNPYWILWWATIGLGYLLAARKFHFWGVAAFFIGHIAADFAWYSVVSLGISRGRSLLGDRGYRILIRVCGFLLWVFGGWFLLSAKTGLAELLF